MNYRITLKRLFIFFLFSMGMHLVANALNHYEPISYLFGMITGCFWAFLLCDD